MLPHPTQAHLARTSDSLPTHNWSHRWLPPSPLELTSLSSIPSDSSLAVTPQLFYLLPRIASCACRSRALRNAPQPLAGLFLDYFRSTCSPLRQHWLGLPPSSGSTTHRSCSTFTPALLCGIQQLGLTTDLLTPDSLSLALRTRSLDLSSTVLHTPTPSAAHSPPDSSLRLAQPLRALSSPALR